MNVYYNPEEFGLAPVASLDIAGSYAFDIFAVWKDSTGRLFWGTDRGCSCPVPFDGRGISDLFSSSKSSCVKCIHQWAKNSDNDVDPATIARFAEMVRNA